MEIVPPNPPAPAQIRKAIVAKRRLEVAKLTLRGLSASAIAERIGAKSATVMADRRANLKAWKRDTTALVADHRARLLSELGAIKAEAWGAWESSKQDATRTRQRHRPVGAKRAKPGEEFGSAQLGPVEVETERKGQTGDPRYLERLVSLCTLEARLLGLLAADTEPPPVPGAVNVDASVRVLVIGDAGLPGDMPWLSNIPAGRAEQGQPLLPPVSESKT